MEKIGKLSAELGGTTPDITKEEALFINNFAIYMWTLDLPTKIYLM